MKIARLTRLIVIIQQKITYSIVKMTRAGVNGQTGSLVEDDDILVLKDNVDGAGGGNNAAAPLGVRELDGEYLTCGGAVPGVHPLTVHKDTLREPFYPSHHRARQPQMLFQQGVHFDAG